MQKSVDERIECPIISKICPDEGSKSANLFYLDCSPASVE